MIGGEAFPPWLEDSPAQFPEFTMLSGGFPCQSVSDEPRIPPRLCLDCHEPIANAYGTRRVRCEGCQDKHILAYQKAYHKAHYVPRRKGRSS